jgi:hypothetical protein
MDDGYGGQFVSIYNGAENNANLSFLQTDLVTGLFYRFRVIALNFNGESEPCDPVGYYVCAAPTDFAGPVVQ